MVRLVWVSFLFYASLLLHAGAIYPELDLSRPVTDQAQIFTDDQKEQIRHEISRLRNKRGIKLYLVTVPDLHGYPVFEYSQMMAKAFADKIANIGNSKNRYAILLIAPHEKKIRLEISKPLKRYLSYKEMYNLLQNNMVPYLRTGHYMQAVENGISGLEMVLSAEREKFSLSSYLLSAGSMILLVAAFLLIAVLFFLFLIYLPDNPGKRDLDRHIASPESDVQQKEKSQEKPVSIDKAALDEIYNKYYQKKNKTKSVSASDTKKREKRGEKKTLPDLLMKHDADPDLFDGSGADTSWDD